MKYKKIEIDTTARAELNTDALSQIEAGQAPGIVFNNFTGAGGLHGLEFNQFGSFHEYTEAKKAIESGQFFTTFELAAKIVETVRPTGTILDPCAGKGIFANFVEESLFTGVEIDPKPVRVGTYCFPRAEWHRANAQFWNTKKRYNYILTNPPFNLRWGKLNSQDFILRKAQQWLKSHGIFAAIVPKSYLSDEMYHKQTRAYIDKHYNWIGQVELDKDAFKELYNVSFETKVIFFQNCEGENYSDSLQTWAQISDRVEQCTEEKKFERTGRK